MKIKVQIKEWRGPFHSEKTGREFYRASVELPDDGGEWSSCRWAVMASKPTPVGAQEVTVLSYDARKGEGMARV